MYLLTHLLTYLFTYLPEDLTAFLQCSDTVSWVIGRAAGLSKAGHWFVGADDLTGTLHVLWLQLSPPPLSSLAPTKSWMEKSILVPASDGCPRKRPFHFISHFAAMKLRDYQPDEAETSLHQW